MIDPRNEEGGGHADDIVEGVSYEAPSPVKKDFLPWHLPRKQYVRDRQWVSLIGQLLDKSGRSSNTLRYLGLPGVDLLDLRYFHSKLCEPRKILLRFLGFNRAAQPQNVSQTELNISLDEVRRLRYVDPAADVVGDDFVRLANDKSIAWKRACEIGPYDVINLDLCDGFAANAPDPLDDTYYSAVSRLMALQARTKDPWLLLLTTRVGQQHVHASVLEKLLEKYVDNFEKCPNFKDESRDLLDLDDETAVRAVPSDAAKLLPVYVCSLCKWLAGLALRYQPPTKTKIMSVMAYKVDGSAPCEDLVSIALKFIPTLDPSDDPLGLATHTLAMPDECASAVQAVRRAVNRTDADQVLQQNGALKEEMVEATARLLELARYDREAYRAWVQRG